MTYKHCAFLGDATYTRTPQGRTVYVYQCTNPEYPCSVCLPSLLHRATKHINHTCPFFRIKSVINSFGARKENGDA